MIKGKLLVTKKIINWGDLDALGITFYPRYYEWMDACGHAFFDAIGLNMWRLWEERNILFGLIETTAKYHRPGRYFNELAIHTYLCELKSKALALRHDIYNIEGQLMVEGLERRICLNTSDPTKFKAMDIPKDIYSTLNSHLKGT